MSEDNSDSVSITIMDRDYKVKCPPDRIEDLEESALYVDAKMREVRTTGTVLSIDRVAVIAALNIAHELISLKHQENRYVDNMHKRIIDLQNKIEAALD